MFSRVEVSSSPSWAGTYGLVSKAIAVVVWNLPRRRDELARDPAAFGRCRRACNVLYTDLSEVSVTIPSLLFPVHLC